MRKIDLIFAGGMISLCAACDLQPKIKSIPDSVGEFIDARYPALLADPETHPEIYNSAAADYGVYASPDLYGSPAGNDYVMYASVDDYIVPPQVAATPTVDVGAEIVPTPTDEYITVPMYGDINIRPKNVDGPVPNVVAISAGDTLYSLARTHNTTVDEIARMNNMTAPYTLSVGQKITLPSIKDAPLVVPARAASAIQKPNTTTRVALREITVAPGDTLYSLSRRYETPVNDLAVMNDLSAPFTLSIGQKLKVPNLASAPMRTADGAKKLKPAQTYGTPPPVVATTTPAKATSATAKIDIKQVSTAPVKTEKKKISSDPTKKLPKLTARSSSKFSWPVRGRVLSYYGAKQGGLFNDGINIGAARGARVGAAENGVVAYAGNEVKGMGNLIILQHAGGWMTVYAHMDSLAVRRGARVNVGDKIGTVGTTGKVDAPQLHFEIRKGTKAYNPSQYLKK